MFVGLQRNKNRHGTIKKFFTNSKRVKPNLTPHRKGFSRPGLPDFSWCMIPKLEKMYKMYRMVTKCTEWSQNIPNIHKIFQMAIKYISIFPPKALKFFPILGFLV
jgi:hypothetical protein